MDITEFVFLLGQHWKHEGVIGPGQLREMACL